MHAVGPAARVHAHRPRGCCLGPAPALDVPSLRQGRGGGAVRPDTPGRRCRRMSLDDTHRPTRAHTHRKTQHHFELRYESAKGLPIALLFATSSKCPMFGLVLPRAKRDFHSTLGCSSLANVILMCGRKNPKEQIHDYGARNLRIPKVGFHTKKKWNAISRASN